MLCFFECDGVHLELHVLTPSFPTRRSSALDPVLRDAFAAARGRVDAIAWEDGWDGEVTFVDPATIVWDAAASAQADVDAQFPPGTPADGIPQVDRKSTRLNSSP